MGHEKIENTATQESEVAKRERLRNEAIEAAREIELDESRPFEQRMAASTLLRNVELEKSLDEMIEKVSTLLEKLQGANREKPE